MQRLQTGMDWWVWRQILTTDIIPLIIAGFPGRQGQSRSEISKGLGPIIICFLHPMLKYEKNDHIQTIYEKNVDENLLHHYL